MADRVAELSRLLADIERARSAVTKAEERMGLLRRMKGSQGWSSETIWKPTLLLKKDKQGDFYNVTMEVIVPYGVVEQQITYEIAAARRVLVNLEGRLP